MKVTEEKGVRVPIIMYHALTEDKSLCGEYVLDTETLEEDMRYLSENGYTAVFMNDLIRYVSYGGQLPDKPVVLTFDDGSYSLKAYLPKLLEKYDMKAAVSIVGDFTTQATESADPPDPRWSYLSWRDVSELRESGYFEFLDHTYAMHCLTGRRGVLRMDGESYETYRRALYNDVIGLQQQFERNCDFRPNVFVYPYGFCSEESRALVESMGFEATLGVEEGNNVLCPGDPTCLFDLHRYNRPAYESTERFMERALKKSS